MIGVNYDLFWTLNPKSLSPFVKAFVLKQNYDDMVAWNEGLYIRMAIASLLDKNTKYPNTPRTMGEKEIVPQENIMKDKFIHKMIAINASFDKEALDESK